MTVFNTGMLLLLPLLSLFLCCFTAVVEAAKPPEWNVVEAAKPPGGNVVQAPTSSFLRSLEDAFQRAPSPPNVSRASFSPDVSRAPSLVFPEGGRRLKRNSGGAGEGLLGEYLEARDKKMPKGGMGLRGKKVPSGFLGLRGRRMDPGADSSVDREIPFGGRGEGSFPPLEMSPPSEGALFKRAPPFKFLGLRGKKRAPTGFLGLRGKKRAPRVFLGLRGKKEYEGAYDQVLNDVLQELYEEEKRSSPRGFLGLRGKKDEDFDDDYFLTNQEQGFSPYVTNDVTDNNYYPTNQERGFLPYVTDDVTDDKYLSTNQERGFPSYLYDDVINEKRRAPTQFLGLRG